MSSNKNSRSLLKKRGLLQDQDTRNQARREFRRVRARRRRQGAKKAQSGKEAGQITSDLLDRKITSYQSLAGGISVQLPATATATASKNRLNSRKARTPSGSDSESESDGIALAKVDQSFIQTKPSKTQGRLCQVSLDGEENIHDTNCWDSFLPTDIDNQSMIDDLFTSKFKNPRDDTQVGLWTWQEQEESFPVLDSVFKMQRMDESEVWDLDKKIEEEKWSSEPSSLEADITTLLSIERQRGSASRDGNPRYHEYSRFPQKLPAKLSDEEMRRGPLPALPPIPLVSAGGREVNISGQPTPPLESSHDKRTHNFRGMAEEEPLPVAHYHYPVDSPTVSAFRFSSGIQVSDFLEPGPLDEPYQIHGGQAEAESSIREDPYDRNIRPSLSPQPDFWPGNTNAQVTQDQKDSLLLRRQRLRKEADKLLSGWAAKNRAPSRRGRANRGNLASPASPASPKNNQANPRLQDNRGPFWHYYNVDDSESHLHNDRMKIGSVF